MPGDETQEYSLFHTKGHSPATILVTLQINGIDLEMELDTGAILSIISEQTYHKLFPVGSIPLLKTSNAQLKIYTEKTIQISEEIEVTV